MFKVILVDDEPSAIRYLKSIIENKCDGFIVVGHAENGEDGIKLVRNLNPDVVVADVKMPGMNGIELAEIIKREFASIYTIIVSSYPDFEYTKGAIKSDVLDYVLKPVNAVQLEELFTSLRQKLCKDYRETRGSMLKRLLKGEKSAKRDLDKFFPFEKYKAVLVRFNGLPPRLFSSKTNKSSLIPEIRLNRELLSNIENVWLLEGRDEMEFICIYVDEPILRNEMEIFITNLLPKQKQFYVTIVCTANDFSVLETQKSISHLYFVLNHVLTLGVSKMLHDNIDLRLYTQGRFVLPNEILNKLSYLVINQRFDEITPLLDTVFKMLRDEKPTQLTLSNELKKILAVIKKSISKENEYYDMDIESLLEELLFSIHDLEDLLCSICDTVKLMVGDQLNPNQKIDTPTFFSSITSYLKENISAHHSLQSVCKEFYISQTYLSKLFRKYENMSFSEYLTKLRIDESIKLIDRNPHMHLKDIAAIVGYSDQFYFSKVFKDIKGVSPSEYKSENFNA